jgi:hypothetical protein
MISQMNSRAFNPSSPRVHIDRKPGSLPYNVNFGGFDHPPPEEMIAPSAPPLPVEMVGHKRGREETAVEDLNLSRMSAAPVNQPEAVEKNDAASPKRQRLEGDATEPLNTDAEKVYVGTGSNNLEHDYGTWFEMEDELQAYTLGSDIGATKETEDAMGMHAPNNELDESVLDEYYGAPEVAKDGGKLSAGTTNDHLDSGTTQAEPPPTDKEGNHSKDDTDSLFG